MIMPLRVRRKSSIVKVPEPKGGDGGEPGGVTLNGTGCGVVVPGTVNLTVSVGRGVTRGSRVPTGVDTALPLGS